MRSQHRFLLAAVMALSICLGSCVTPKPTIIAAPTQVDRLIQAYSEIQNGRLLILADFEDEKQMGIFQLESATNPGRLARDPKNGRPETGTASLAVSFASPNESVVIANTRESQWSLQRDWRPYDLLMMAVNSPVAGLTLETKIVGGVGGNAVETRTESVFIVGWNLLRFDLLEIGEQVPLDDIQEIRLSLVNAPAGSVTLHFDDFLLAGNRRHLLGDSANQSASLYVQNAGRHWNVGAGGCFEISIRNGQIIRWYNLAADPHRLRNLVRGASLGPVPVLVDERAAVKPATSLGGALNARQRILEMNEVRVVIDCSWQSDSQAAAAPTAHWTYTVYPTGQIFVSAATSTLRQDVSGQPGLAFNMAWSPTAPSVQVVQSESVQSGSTVSPLAAYALARSTEADAAMLLIPYPDAAPGQLKEFSDTTSRTSSLIWSKSRSDEPKQTWRCQLLLASAMLAEAEAVARANDYTQTGSVRIEVGTPQTGPMLRADGYDPSTGCFHLATDGNRARIVVDGKKRPAYSPTFQFNGGSTDQAWVYVNYLLHQKVVRGPRGEALIQLPGTVMKEIVVEPLFKNSPSARP